MLTITVIIFTPYILCVLFPINASLISCKKTRYCFVPSDIFFYFRNGHGSSDGGGGGEGRGKKH